MDMQMLGIIGGSGLYDIPELEINESVKVTTPYGEPSDFYRVGRLKGRATVFLPRHGFSHHIQPHKVNYRANLWGFREIGAGKIISICASGGISPEMMSGVLAVPDQIIDMTSGRASTFYDGDEVVHIDFTEPFCPDMRGLIIEAAADAGVSVVQTGTYICTNGPRLETAAEISAYANWGADMVGMTLMPEAVLARELQICFAAVAVITNAAAGIAAAGPTTKEVIETMLASSGNVGALLRALYSRIPRSSSCGCKRALKEAGI